MLRNLVGRRQSVLLVGLLLAAALGASGLLAWARSPVAGAPDVVALAELPAQGRATYALIVRGGPFPHEKDGTVFGNRERLLPEHKRGYYREYTVATPGARDRGARRIVCGGQEVSRPAACYYTDDHYASFRRILPGQPLSAPGRVQ
jgi:ribonuclease T1